jgi:hypothetical protein
VPPKPHVSDLQSQIIALRAQGKSWGDIAAECTIPGKWPRQRARRLWQTAQQAIAQRQENEAALGPITSLTHMTPRQKDALKELRAQGPLRVTEKEPVVRKPSPPQSPVPAPTEFKGRIVFRFPSTRCFEDVRNGENIEVAIRQDGGKFFDANGVLVQPVDVIRWAEGWAFQSNGSWVDLYTRRSIDTPHLFSRVANQ